MLTDYTTQIEKDEVIVVCSPSGSGKSVELAHEGTAMMVVVTHDMGFACNVSNRVLCMDQGRIVEDAVKEAFFGTPREERAQLFLSKILSNYTAPRHV